MQYLGPRVPNFRPFRSTTICFQNIAHFRIFALTPTLKFQSATNFLIVGRSTKHVYKVIFSYGCLIYHKLWLRSDKNDRRRSILKISSSIWSSVNKKFHNIFNFLADRQHIYNFYSPMTTLFIIKFGSDQMKL